MITTNNSEFELENGNYLVHCVAYTNMPMNVIDTFVLHVTITDSEDSSLWGFISEHLSVESFYITGITKGK